MNFPPAILGAIVVAGLCYALVYLMGITKKWGILVPVLAMMLFGSMSLPLTWNDRINPTIWLPLQSNRSTLYLGFGVLACLMMVFQTNRLRGKSVSVSAVLLLLSGLYASSLRMVHNTPLDAAQSIVLSIVTLVPFLLTAAMIIDRFNDLIVLVRGIVVLGLAWLGMTGMQIVVNPSYVTTGNQNRFVGLYANPQHSGAFMAFLCVCILWLLLNDLKRFKMIYLGLLSVSGILLMWTGSRTGMGMAVVGISATLYSRVGRAILFLPVVGVVGYAGLKVLVGVMGDTAGIERLASTANTRDYAWWKLISVGMENPIFGAGTELAEMSENSWLYGFASYGILMLAILLGIALIGGIEMLRSFRARFTVHGEYRNYFDFLNGLMMMYFAGAVLEGYMVSRVNSTLGFFMMASVANANLRRLAKRGEVEGVGSWGAYEDEWHTDGTDQYYGDYGDYGENESDPGYA